MQNSERQPFDNTWQKAFDGAEMAPPDRLWHSIESELAGGETASMKKRVVFYQRLAAATVLFALMTGAYAIYNNSRPSEIATSSPRQEAPANARVESPGEVAEAAVPNASSPENNSNALRADSPSPRLTRSTARGNTTQTSGNSTGVPPNTVVLAENNSNVIQKNDQPAGFDEVREPETVVALNEQPQETAEIANQIPKEEKVEVAQILSADQINAIAEADAKKEKTAVQRAPWLGVGAAAGSFAPSAAVGGGAFGEADMSQNYSTPSPNTPQSQSESVGSAYSAGVSGGVRISKRWVLQSGLNYVNQQVDYTTNFVGVSSSNQASAMTKDYMSSQSLYTAVVNPYEVSSATEILSIPVQAGYMIVDRKIGWQVSSGVSTDFLLRNTLTDKSGLRNKVTEGVGEDSPYRAVNWAALLNTEISYQLGNHYRLALVPGMRYSFQSMLKNSSAGTPLILDVGFRFKYLFN